MTLFKNERVEDKTTNSQRIDKGANVIVMLVLAIALVSLNRKVNEVESVATSAETSIEELESKIDRLDDVEYKINELESLDERIEYLENSSHSHYY
ncbi:MAG: hypothetical protein WDO15_19625 [Bacteroidota bacterium]